MDVFTTEPGVQLYTANWMTGNFIRKNGKRYPMRAAICLETQHFPDSPNHEKLTICYLTLPQKNSKVACSLITGSGEK